MKQTIGNHLHRNNPFYLLSAVCMLVGCLAQSRALGITGFDWKPLAGLIGVLQLYELLVIALAAYLVKRVGAVRDGTMLLLLEVLFLVDATYLNAEMAASHPKVAPVLTSLLFALAVTKILLVRRLLGLRSARGLVASIMQVGVLLYLPVFYAVTVDRGIPALGLGRGELSLVALVFWWLLGAVMILGRWALDGDTDPPHPVARALSTVPLIAMVAHLAVLHGMMYQLPLHASYLTPLVIGLGVRWYPFFTDAASRAVAWASPLVGLVLSIGAPSQLVFDYGPLTITPFRIALIAVAMVYWLQRDYTGERAFAWASLLSLGGGVSGSSPTAIFSNWSGVVPETAAELGTFGILAAFAFLALGLAFSLWRPSPPSDVPPSAPRARRDPPRATRVY